MSSRDKPYYDREREERDNLRSKRSRADPHNAERNYRGSRDNNTADHLSFRQQRRQRPQILSRVGNVSGVEAETEEIKEGGSEDKKNYGPPLDMSEKRPLKSQDTTEGVTRNKRMFGNMMGHLGMAKKKVEEDAKEREKRQLKETFNKNLKSLQAQVEEVDRDRVRWMQGEVQSMMDFLVTSSEPIIQWRPTEHNTQTQEMLEERKKQAEILVAERLGREEEQKNSLMKEIELLKASQQDQ